LETIVGCTAQFYIVSTSPYAEESRVPPSTGVEGQVAVININVDASYHSLWGINIILLI